MGWKDAPVVESPAGQPAWMSAPEVSAEPKASMGEVIAGTPLARLAMGAVSPLIGAAQLGAHAGDKLNELMGVEPMVSPWIDKQLAEYEAAKQRGMKASGTEGFDWMGLMGSMAPAGAMTKGVTEALPAATSALGRIGTGAAIGGITSATQPVLSPDFWTDKAKQAGMGAAIGGAIPAVGEAGKAMIGTPALNPTKAATLAEGQAAGYVVPPSTVNPSFLNNRLESIAGKASVGQEAAHRNQEITNIMAAKALGLPPDTSLTEGGLNQFRKVAGKPYADIGALSGEASDTLESLKQARFLGNKYKMFSDRSGDPAAYIKAQDLKDTAQKLEQHLESMANAQGRSDLVQALPAARKAIAKSYDIERALNMGDSNVSAPVIGRKFDKVGEKGLTGELATIGKMAQAFPAVMREGARVPASGVSGTDAAASALLGVAGAAGGGPMGLLAGGLPLLRGPARNLVLSPGYQQLATQGLSLQQQAMVDALMQRGAGAAGTMAGRGAQP